MLTVMRLHLVVRTDDEYVRTAVELATDLTRLAELRRTLREQTRASPLADGRGLAAVMEAAYQSMWRDWCATGPSQMSAGA